MCFNKFVVHYTCAHLDCFMQNAIVDWGWRAVHLSVVAGKQIAAQYYRQAPKKSYYAGCSTG